MNHPEPMKARAFELEAENPVELRFCIVKGRVEVAKKEWFCDYEF